jgi:hypothetical protein
MLTDKAYIRTCIHIHTDKDTRTQGKPDNVLVVVPRATRGTHPRHRERLVLTVGINEGIYFVLGGSEVCIVVE